MSARRGMPRKITPPPKAIPARHTAIGSNRYPWRCRDLFPPPTVGTHRMFNSAVGTPQSSFLLDKMTAKTTSFPPHPQYNVIRRRSAWFQKQTFFRSARYFRFQAKSGRKFGLAGRYSPAKPATLGAPGHCSLTRRCYRFVVNGTVGAGDRPCTHASGEF